QQVDGARQLVVVLGIGFFHRLQLLIVGLLVFLVGLFVGRDGDRGLVLVGCDLDGVLVVGVLQRMRQIGLVQPLAGQRFNLGLFDHDVGGDALGLDRAARRRVITRGCQAK